MGGGRGDEDASDEESECQDFLSCAGSTEVESSRRLRFWPVGILDCVDAERLCERIPDVAGDVGDPGCVRDALVALSLVGASVLGRCRGGSAFPG